MKMQTLGYVRKLKCQPCVEAAQQAIERILGYCISRQTILWTKHDVHDL
jgi:hypothetical protein